MKIGYFEVVTYARSHFPRVTKYTQAGRGERLFLAVQCVLTACVGIKSLVYFQAGGLAATMNISSHIRVIFLKGVRMKTIAKLILTVVSLLIVSCSSIAWCQVECVGALKNIMHKADISPQIDLKDLSKMKNLYALGAVGNLKGEILILDGFPYVTSVKNNKVLMDHSFDKSATLLVYSQIEQWKEIPIPPTVRSYKELELFVESAANKHDVDTLMPFPFLVKGIVEELDWHVIDWKQDDPVHTHEKHKKAGAYGIIKNENVLILGFYSKKHKGIFTHHSTDMHLHFKTEDNKRAGHVDDLILGKEKKLFLPINK